MSRDAAAFTVFNYRRRETTNTKLSYSSHQSYTSSLYSRPSSRFEFSDGHELSPPIAPIKRNSFQRTTPIQSPQSPSPRLPSLQKSKQSFRITYEIHDGFTSGEERIIVDALKYVCNRLCKNNILQNMYDICGKSGYFLEKGAWSRSQLKNHKNYGGPHDLLRYQLMCLRKEGEKDQFPTIHIYPMYETTEIQSRGNVNCVSCICHGYKFSIAGEFVIKLNRYHLGALDKYGSDPVYWGGVIVREMLHNLGHTNEDDDYSDQWQINVFEQCFIHDGNYNP